MTGKPGLLQSMRLQRVGHDLVTEQPQQSYVKHLATSKSSLSGSYQLPPFFFVCDNFQFYFFHLFLLVGG